MIAGLNVLVVEDDLEIAWAIAEALNEVGAFVIGPMSGVADTLKELMLRKNIRAAILDTHLIDGDIIPVAKILSSRKIPIVLYTDAPFLEMMLEYEGVINIVPKFSSIIYLLKVLELTIASAKLPNV